MLNYKAEGIRTHAPVFARYPRVKMCFQKPSVLLTVAVVLLSVLAAVQAIDICDLCKCNRVQGEVKSISCDCNTQNKVLKLSRDKMSNVMHITSFAVSNCSSVTFDQSSFANSHDLQNVSISRVHQVLISVGVFSSLSSLLVEDVGDLQIAKMGLMGAGDVNEIIIHRSNISVLPSLALFDVKGLKKIELKGVIIGAMKQQAIGLKMADESKFIIEGCEVDTIDSGAVVLETTHLEIIDTRFHHISSQAVNVSATKGTDIIKNFFGPECSNQGIVVKSNRIEIDRNIFNILPIGLLKNVQNHTGSIAFTNNIVFNFTLTSGGVDLSTMLNLDEFYDNEVVCDCNLAKSVLAYQAFQSASEPRIVVQQNNCYTESDCKLTLQMLSDEQSRLCDGDNMTMNLDELCESLPERVEPMSPEREGRAEFELPTPGVDTSSTTLETTTHVQRAHEAAPHHTNSAVLGRTANNVFVSLMLVLSSAQMFGF